jgi:hypothetical protein
MVIFSCFSIKLHSALRSDIRFGIKICFIKKRALESLREVVIFVFSRSVITPVIICFDFYCIFLFRFRGEVGSYPNMADGGRAGVFEGG